MGVIPLLLGNWRIILLGVLLLVIGVQTWRLDSAKKETIRVQAAFDTFKAETAALGERAKREAAEKEAADRERKGKADAENEKTRRDLAGVYDAYRKLRDSRSAGSRILPEAAPGAAGAATASFDRAALDRALSDFDSGATGLLEEGDKAITDLDTAKRWAQQ